MASNSFDITLLKGSIQETEFTEDIVTECLARCSDCKGEYVNFVLRHKFVCHCICHKTTTLHHQQGELNIL